VKHIDINVLDGTNYFGLLFDCSEIIILSAVHRDGNDIELVKSLQITDADGCIQAPRVGQDNLPVTTCHELCTFVAGVNTTFIFFGQ
jgi:hypothetical protein